MKTKNGATAKQEAVVRATLFGSLFMKDIQKHKAITSFPESVSAKGGISRWFKSRR
ncbi:MAG TPA: hypothetical protein VF599_00070 [Pyrinomonadaceae bacterium]